MAIFNLFAIFLATTIITTTKIKADTPLQIEDLRGFPKLLKEERFDVRTIDPRYKLPEPVIPTNYDLKLIPILQEEILGRESWTAYGSVGIYVDCVEATSQITLHKSPDLEIVNHSISVRTSGSSSIVIPVLVDEITFDEETEFFTIPLNGTLTVGVGYTIYIEFIAPIYGNGRLEGMYRSNYTNAEGFVSHLATTQFQPTDFRRLVPSFDEPHLKAVFYIQVGRLEAKYQTLSNSELEENENHPPIDAEGFEDWVWDIYKPTVKTSTYLIAIVVAENYTSVEATPGLYRKPVKTFGPAELILRGGGIFAAETAARQLTFYENYFEVMYPMHKMDSIAIPHFSAGAMENWGLNTYRIQYLLNFDGETTEAERGLISNILAHELGHQWFGNPVTCANWTNLWLNEGFATYVSYLGWQHTDPEFEARKFFMNDAFQYSMVRDANSAITHPVINDGVTTEEINSYFSAITYEKGGSLIRMMEGFLGELTLRKGLIRYLDDMYYKGALQDDLWRNLNDQAEEDDVLPTGVTVKDIMDTWTLQSGFPVVRVSAASANRIFISQEKITALSEVDELDPAHFWYVPVAIATADEWTATPKLWIEPQYILKSYSPIDTTKWLVVNPSATGYYRVLYDTKLTNLLLDQLNLDHTVFAPESRSQFLDDYLTMAFSRHVSIETALEFTKYLGNEVERISWGAALSVLRNSFNKLKETDAYEAFKIYLVPRLESTLSTIGLMQEVGERGTNVTFRATLLDWACAMESTECVGYANSLYNIWSSFPNPNINPVPVDIQAVMYCAIVANGDADTFEFIFQRYEALAGVQKTRLLNGLACSADTTLLESLLAEVLKQEDSRLASATDKINAIVRVAANSKARAIVLNFLGSNLDTLKDLTDSIERSLESLVANMGTADELIAMTTFFTDNSDNLDELNLPTADYLATINSNIAWRSEYEERMRAWFASNI